MISFSLFKKKISSNLKNFVDRSSYPNNNSYISEQNGQISENQSGMNNQNNYSEANDKSNNNS